MWVYMGIALTARLLLICYAEIQDKVSEIQYTDIDYRVFTDAARHVLKGESPFERYTYRYTPLLAYILTPNLVFHPAWGKFLFSIIDIVVAILIKNIVQLHYKSATESMAEKCALVWLYNPLTIVISTRGNADSLAAALVILTILFMKKENYMLAGAIHGVAIHTRLYPIAFSLAMYTSIPAKPRDGNSLLSKMLSYLRPNRDRLRLVFGCFLTFSTLTLFFYKLYGFKFLHESMLFHLRRHDVRHNFSVYFYYQYLSFFSNPIYLKMIAVAPQVTLLLVFSVLYGTSRDLLFCILCQAIVLVAYNSVLTCQYFVWFFSLLPLCLLDLKLSKAQGVALASLWLIAQLTWLLPAYWLEFKGRNTFLYIWIQGVAFFCANMAVLARLIRSYKQKDKEE